MIQNLLKTTWSPTMRNGIITLLIIPFFLPLSSCKKREEVTIDNTSDFEVYLVDEMIAQNIPALSVLLFKEENILYEKYLGRPQLEKDTTLDQNHLFLLASISKVVTATALLQLLDDGLFSLDDKINDYLSFQVQVPNYTTDISFRMLLTHTSGIADGSALDGQYYYGEDSPVALGDFLENYLVPDGDFYKPTENFHDFEPGSVHEYSNVGNALIGLLVEQISGMSFNGYCQQNIFAPLGMTHTFWRLDEINQTIAQPYNYINGQYEAIQHYTFTDYPNGGLRSTGRDLFIFLSAFVQEGTANNFQLLKPETIKAMATLQIPSLDDGMGLHLFNLDLENDLWGHDGGEQGVATIMAFNPSTKIGAIILTNQGEVNLDQILVESYKLGLKF